jgi:membrane protein DedA with SNARE-associated domain
MLENFSDYGYLGVFVALLASGFGFPLPEEFPVLTAGVLVGHGDTDLRWWAMLPVCIAGVVLGDVILYSAGRLWGARILANAWVRRKLISPERRVQIEKNFHDRGVMILLTARLTPGIRTPVFIMAGVLRVPVARFLLADGLYALPGVSVLFWLGYSLTDQVLEAFHSAERYRPLIVFGVLSAVAGVIVYHLFTARRVSTGNRSEVPLYNRPVEKVTEVVEHAVEKAVEKAVEVVAHRSHPDRPSPLPEDAKPPAEPSANGSPSTAKMTNDPPAGMSNAPREPRS